MPRDSDLLFLVVILAGISAGLIHVWGWLR